MSCGSLHHLLSSAGATTWRDGAGTWPHSLESDRSLVVDPDSVGVRIQGPGNSEAEAVLFRGALADAGGITTTGELINEALDVTSSEKFGRLLDNLVPQAFGVA